MIRLTFMLLMLASAFTVQAQDRLTGGPRSTRSPVMARNGMVATSHPLATQIGLGILQRGGSAVDAAIAANAALGFLEPTGCGIGGDLFAIIWDAKTKRLYGLNGSGRSPRSLTRQMLLDQGLERIPSYGPLPVSVPGTVDAWFALHGRFGKLPVSELLAPAIRYAEEGAPLPPLIAWYLGRALRQFRAAGYPNIEATYFPDGRIPGEGDLFRNPMLAATYRRIAEGGRDAFYRGETARTIASFIRSQGGHLSEQDLADHRSEWVEPVSVPYRGHDVWELPPNGQGIAALQMLRILEAYNFDTIPFGSDLHLHLVVEAKKLAFEDRARYYADMDFAQVPVDSLLSATYAANRRALIDPDKAGSYLPGLVGAPETIYLTTADKEGNMVSLIQSNFRGMGSGMVPPGLGFMLQDRGELFTLEEGRANTYEPGKRPFHTIIPAFVTRDGEPVMSFGVMGGDFQPQGHVQVLMNILDFGMDIQEAGDVPRWQHSGGSDPSGPMVRSRGKVQLESGFAWEAVRGLMRRGHEVGWDLGSYGGYQAIWYDKTRGIYLGASESRKDGQAAGY